MRFLVVFSSFILFTSMGHAAPSISNEALAQAAELRNQAMSEGTPAYRIVESLTTEVGPRMGGTPADTRAVKWAVNKFKELDYDKVWTEPVTFETWQRGIEKAEVITPFPQPLLITALGRSVGTPKEGITAEIAHFKTFEDLVAAKREEVEGKIVFISYKMERAIDGAGYGKAVAARSRGAIEGAKKGARAVLIRSIGTDDDRLPHTGNMNYEEGVAKIPSAALSNPDADLLLNMLRRDKPVTLKLTMTSGPGPEFTSYNVIGEIKGSEKPDEIVLLGAHLDSWDLGTGAIDDGAGVAIVMAAGHMIGKAETPPRRTIRVVLFANEEQGLLGAKAYLERHSDHLSKHITGAESDFGAGKIYQLDSLVKEESLGAVDHMSQLMAPLGIKRGHNQARPGPDLIPVYTQGMSVFALRQDGTDYFDYHHTANDTLDKIDPANLDQNVAAYIVFALVSANMNGDFGFRLNQPESQ